MSNLKYIGYFTMKDRFEEIGMPSLQLNQISNILNI
jgi:hypothetical protein